jgi:DDE domain
VLRFAPLLADAARPCRHAVGDRWQVDETSVRAAGRWRHVDRAVDQSGQVIDVFVSARRDARAARRFFQRAIGATKVTPDEVSTDQAPAYPVVLEDLLPAPWHRTEQDANNRGRVRPRVGWRARLRRCVGASRTAASGWSSLGMHPCSTFGVDATSWRSRSQRTGGWPWRSTNWPWWPHPRRRLRLQPALSRGNATAPA